MAPSESSILRNFLLPPAPLPVALPFDQFKDLFPRSLQANPEVVALYRELQHQRAIDMDDVKRNVETEVKKGELQQREVLRARKKSQEAEMKDIDQHELVMEAEVFPFSYVITPVQANHMFSFSTSRPKRHYVRRTVLKRSFQRCMTPAMIWRLKLLSWRRNL